jgi:hypothetical protein
MGTVCNIGWELYDACNGNILSDALFWGVVRDEEKKEDGGDRGGATTKHPISTT